ncbi:Acetyltransferase (GNAT) domain-containing protein [Natronoarchaeum philippinense]|uniref:Acetyltransferase (GNAT) domain-containing protein n=1 Tax=Natronoarchaeum philippinense TaxID=558529 RepID=A0A285P3H8_NATPI|nr:GNAT family N-acetyltransferase [Natronoarchaeum philippinense]SNZ15998.1 Acetyltransferase (GNAT) domain-containing protein [Natronoarchaeum philippinense]
MSSDSLEATYEIRRYRPEDRAGVIALDDAVWDRNRGGRWFDWKYGANPYVDHVPLFVAVEDGTVVGARPFMAFRLRAGETTALALQPADTMVHPDHRRKGIFTRMNERAIEFYQDNDADLFFNFPNEASLPGYLNLGWRRVDDKRTFYRVQSPDTFVPQYAEGRAATLLGQLAAPIVRGYHEVRTELAQPPPELAVDLRPGVDAAALTDLYRANPPTKFHARRDEEFYEWRFGSPVWSRSTYVAAENGEPVVGAVARTRQTNGGVEIAQIAEIVPMDGGRRWREALAELLGDVLGDHADADLVAVTGSIVPDDVLAAYGFSPDDRLPLSKFSDHRCALVTRPVDGESWSLDGRELTRTVNWLLSYGERDTT